MTGSVQVGILLCRGRTDQLTDATEKTYCITGRRKVHLRQDSVGTDTETSTATASRAFRQIKKKIVSVTGCRFRICFRANGITHDYFPLARFLPCPYPCELNLTLTVLRKYIKDHTCLILKWQGCSHV